MLYRYSSDCNHWILANIQLKISKLFKLAKYLHIQLLNCSVWSFSLQLSVFSFTMKLISHKATDASQMLNWLKQILYYRQQLLYSCISFSVSVFVCPSGVIYYIYVHRIIVRYDSFRTPPLIYLQQTQNCLEMMLLLPANISPHNTNLHNVRIVLICFLAVLAWCNCNSRKS